MVLVLDSSLGMKYILSLFPVDTLFREVMPKVSRLVLLDQRPWLEPRLDYGHRVAVDINGVDMSTALALGSGLDPRRIFRTLEVNILEPGEMSRGF